MEALPADRRAMIVAWAFAKLDVFAFTVASAAIGATVLLALTLALLIKGAPPGMPIGPHLASLAELFPGYAVSVGGAFLGALYASAIGGALGFVLASIWNFAHWLVLAVIRVQANLATYSID